MLGNKCIKLLKCYSEKVEVQMCKLTDAIGDSDSESVDNLVDEDCELLRQAENYLIELEQFTENMKAKKIVDGKGHEVKTESSRLIDLQEQMQDLLFRQMQQQRELMERQEEREKRQKGSVKLPKLDLCTFNGNKLKWAQFWDACECTVHTNRDLSPIDKFNYLQSKVVGEAKQSIAGLALSKENYDVAVTILKERFGNPQEAVDLHYNKLINIPIPSEKVESLRIFLDTIERHLHSLEVLKENTNQHVFISMIRSKLPRNVLRNIELKCGSKTEWTVHKLRDEIREYVVACERAESKDGNTTQPEIQRGGTPKFQRYQNKPHYPAYRPEKISRPVYNAPASAEALAVNVKSKATSNVKDRCRYCSERHWSDECLKYKTVEERKRKLNGSCFKCLKEGHLATECKSKKVCVHCGEMNKHHRNLCPKKFEIRSSSVHLSEEISDATPQEDDMSAEGHVLISSNEMVLMQTAQTEICNEQNFVYERARLLFDSGSQRTYITERLATKLGLKPEDEQELKLVTFGSENTKVIKTKSAKISIKLNNGSYMKITANVVPTISGTIQRNPVKQLLTKQMENLVNSVEMADTIPSVKEYSTVEVLIGNDYYLDIVLLQIIEIEPDLYLLGSKLGWILTGRTSEVEKGMDTVNMLVLTYGNDVTNHSVFTSIDSAITTKPNLEDFWNIESIGITDNVQNSNDEIAMKKFKETIKFEDGRYHVTWPWRDEEFELPENRQLALGRLKSNVSRMSSKPELMKRYNEVIEDQLNKGVIEKVSYKVQDGMTHYIPHHAVINPEKLTTKLRIVYNASSKTRKENKSLNECLYRGPVILQHLCGILLRFRLHKIALVADIEKAFLQIGLQLDQRDVTRFLWLKDINAPTVDSRNIQEYRFCRVPFGVISSPFLLGATVQSHMDTYNTDLAQQVKDNMYVDNLITGTSTEGEAIHFYMFGKASMNLREWISNSDIVNKYIPSDSRADTDSMSVLGLCWDPKNYTISLKPAEVCDMKSPTKRAILKNVASKFDPLGLFSPVLLRGKLLIQQLWQKGLDWDDEISEEDASQWNIINSDLESLSSQKLQRCVTTERGNCVHYSLICFCDASKLAYSTAIYLRQSTTVETKTELVFSKSRLAPVKVMTIPKLEIMAVAIGVRCIKFVQCQLKLPLQHLQLYTDSQCVLKWIHSEKDLPVFVKNRVNEIKTHRDITFAYVKVGRLQYAELSEGSRYPILVPKKDKFTHLLVERHHKEIMHCGESQTLSNLRYKYCIPQGRATVKSVLRQCTVCRRCEGGPYKVPEMPPLPKVRVASSSPFTYTGLDYLGPLNISQ
ncbi:uncharacterized protein LOC128555967 [Mercenaria mercenaria]|uniref:uncharacterized protein LOC128555967 n=1 Tax=Mercenaria mercenaria TaxID=6596 RepID=UPI00234EC4BE|nr:uncharacterized protein LOC128555967 [Mercenaria mercenaria]